MSNENYSEKEQTCKGCFGPCGRCDDRKLTARDLALFLGCEIEWMGERGYTLTGINTGDEYLNPVGLKKGEYHYWSNIENVRPVLRPVSAMTEQEARRAYEIENGKAWLVPPEQSCLILYWAKFAERHVPNAKASLGAPAVWAYFLSIGLDVFGWIPAGLAVDATKKEVEP